MSQPCNLATNEEPSFLRVKSTRKPNSSIGDIPQHFILPTHARSTEVGSSQTLQSPLITDRQNISVKSSRRLKVSLNNFTAATSPGRENSRSPSKGPGTPKFSSTISGSQAYALGSTTSFSLNKSGSHKNNASAASSPLGFTSSIFATQPSQFYSSSTLRHSASIITFLRSKRFSTPKSSTEFGAKYDLASQLSTKTTSQGIGERQVFSQVHKRNASQNPPPGAYLTHQSLSSPKTAKSFGIPFSYYVKTYMPQSSIREPETTNFIPGVGSYEVAEKIGQAKLKFSLLGKLKDPQVSSNPSCNRYNPNEKLVRSSRFSETTFGHGKKFDFTQFNKVLSPGPASYTLPSAFDKFDGSKTPLRTRSKV